MPTKIAEKNIEFTFGNAWVIGKYDSHADTQPIIGVVEHRKAVDFVGLHGGIAFLIEVKDYRGFRIANKPKTNGALNEAMAQKVHDTLSGLLLTHRRAPKARLWRESLNAFRLVSGEVRIVLWLEDEALFRTTAPNGKSAAGIFTARLKQHLKWVPGKVLVVNRAFSAGGLPDVTAKDLPGAAGHGGVAAGKGRK
jgi:hypothetical protein